ncbi:DUF6624 domain-containing protein [Niveibacterium sp. COAC-50]|uniref:DUF6624 domain-containing protein n=1 Tax=Niveibacterium sp. COAC-50 TaxID=2729384 RepID=UPI001556184F|nr:DUF6624 domain-containing protein [Niveibacterium sp. COAC-50]
MRQLRLGVILSAALAWAPLATARADFDEAALFKACPGVAAFYAKQSAEKGPAPVVATDKARQAALLERVAEDQALRDELVRDMSNAEAISKVKEVDARNLAWLKADVERRGFPARAEVGDDGIRAAWLLIQHADTDRAFQKKALEAFLAEPERYGVRKDDIALLTDRTLVGEGKLQRYGSQFDDKDGRLVLQPVEAPESLESRRAAMGLPSMADYACMMQTMYRREVELTPR